MEPCATLFVRLTTTVNSNITERKRQFSGKMFQLIFKNLSLVKVDKIFCESPSQLFFFFFRRENSLVERRCQFYKVAWDYRRRFFSKKTHLFYCFCLVGVWTSPDNSARRVFPKFYLLFTIGELSATDLSVGMGARPNTVRDPVQ